MTFYDDFEGEEKNLGDVLEELIVWFYTYEDSTIRICYIQDGERGFHRVGQPTAHKPTIFSSTEKAKEYCYALNEKAGICRAEVDRVVHQSMRIAPWRVSYDDDLDRVNIWHGDKIVASPEWFEAKEHLMPALLRELYGGSIELFQDEMEDMAEAEKESNDN